MPSSFEKCKKKCSVPVQCPRIQVNVPRNCLCTNLPSKKCTSTSDGSGTCPKIFPQLELLNFSKMLRNFEKPLNLAKNYEKHSASCLHSTHFSADSGYQ